MTSSTFDDILKESHTLVETTLEDRTSLTCLPIGFSNELTKTKDQIDKLQYVKDGRIFLLCPLVARYGDNIERLSVIFSEGGYILFRIYVEALNFISKFKHLIKIRRDMEPDNNHHDLTDEEVRFILSHFQSPFIVNKNDECDKITGSYFRHQPNPNCNYNAVHHVRKGELTTRHDVKAIENYMKEILNKHERLNKYVEWVHFSLTSEDVNSCAHAMMLRSGIIEFNTHFMKVYNQLNDFSEKYADTPMMAHTHGQPAVPITVGKEFANYKIRLMNLIQKLNEVKVKGKINGATGGYNALFVLVPDLDPIQNELEILNALKIDRSQMTTQIEPHDYISEIMGFIAQISTIGQQICLNMWIKISKGYFKQKVVKNEIGSSAMPHKVNPIFFENALANFRLALTMSQGFVSYITLSLMERDLADSSLIRNMGMVFGYITIAFDSLSEGFSRIEPNLDILNNDLDEHYELLSEPIQNILRIFGIDGYQKLKEITRGNKITKDDIDRLIEDIKPIVGDKYYKILKDLTPYNYIGLNSTLALGLN